MHRKSKKIYTLKCKKNPIFVLQTKQKMKKVDYTLLAVAFFLLGIVIFAYQCHEEKDCTILGAWNTFSVSGSDTTKAVYCFTEDSLIAVFTGKKISGRLSIPISITPNEINVYDKKGQVWPYENTCDTLLLKNIEGLQTLWR